jgi:hypothetical protein
MRMGWLRISPARTLVELFFASLVQHANQTARDVSAKNMPFPGIAGCPLKKAVKKREMEICSEIYVNYFDMKGRGFPLHRCSKLMFKAERRLDRHPHLLTAGAGFACCLLMLR